MPRAAYGAAAALLAVALAACGPGEGFVEVKILPGYAVPALAIGGERLDLKSDTLVLKRKVGPAKLQAAARDGNLFPFCDFEVRKNRITTVSVSSTGRELRCRVQS